MASNIFKDVEAGNIAGLRRTMSVFPSSIDSRRLKDNRAPLHVAASIGNAAIASELLAHNAPHDAVDRDGNTALHLAAEQGAAELAVVLMTGPGRRLLLRVKNKDGQTPLHLAVKMGHAEMIARLVEAGARTDAKDKAGRTPIDIAPCGNEAVAAALAGGGVAPSVDIASARSEELSAPSAATNTTTTSSQLKAAINGVMPLNTTTTSMQPKAAATGVMPPNTTTTTTTTSTQPKAATSGVMPPNTTTAGTHSKGPVSGIMAPKSLATVKIALAGAHVNRNSGVYSSSTTPAPFPGGASPAVRRGSTSGIVPAPAGKHVIGRNSTGSRLSTSAVTPSTGPGQGPGAGQAAALRAVMADVQSIQHDLRQSAHSRAAMAAAHQGVSEQLLEALELVHLQSQRLEDMESRLLLQEQRRTGERHRSELLSGRLEELEGMQKKEAELEQSVSRLTTQQLSLQTTLQELHCRMDSLPSEALPSTASPLPSPSKADYDMLHALVLDQAKLWQSHTAQLEDMKVLLKQVTAQQGCETTHMSDLHAQVQQVAQDMKQLSEKAPASTFTEQAPLGLPERVSVLELRLAQQTASVSSLSTQLGAVSEKLIVSMSQTMNIGASPSTVERAADSASVVELAANLRQVQADIAEVKEKLLSLGASAMDIDSLEAGADPTPTPSTPAGLVTPGGRPDDDALQMHGQFSELREALTGMRTEFKSDSGALRREYHKALSDMQQRFMEQRSELGEREAKIKQLRELALREEEERRGRCEFEAKIQADIVKVDTAIGFVQHKVEVLEDQMLNLMANDD